MSASFFQTHSHLPIIWRRSQTFDEMGPQLLQEDVELNLLAVPNQDLQLGNSGFDQSEITYHTRGAIAELSLEKLSRVKDGNCSVMSLTKRLIDFGGNLLKVQKQATIEVTFNQIKKGVLSKLNSMPSDYVLHSVALEMVLDLEGSNAGEATSIVDILGASVIPIFRSPKQEHEILGGLNKAFLKRMFKPKLLPPKKV